MATLEKFLETSSSSTVPELSIVVPVYFNAKSLQELYDRLNQALTSANVKKWDVVFVDDGSGDESWNILLNLHRQQSNVRIVRLSRNFGSTEAILAGLGFATGRSVAVIAADLQTSPDILGEMVDKWRAGAKVVLARRDSRDDPLFSRFFSFLFYQLFRWLVPLDMPRGGFDMFLVDSQVARLLSEHAEKNSSIPATLLWLGFDRQEVSSHRSHRRHGQSMWTFAKKLKLMYDSILSFSYVPLRLVTLLGLIGIFMALGYATLIVVMFLLKGELVAGWASLMVTILFFNGMVLVALGVVGEYVWRGFDAARKRPIYVVSEQMKPRRSNFSGQEPLEKKL